MISNDPVHTPLRGCIPSAVFLSVSVAHAGTQSRAIDFEYNAAPGCPSESEFTAKLAGIARDQRRAERDDGGQRALVVVGPSGVGAVGAVGRLTLVAPSGETSTREIGGESCAQVVDALVLILHLALDPDASLDSRSAPPPVSLAPAPSPAPVDAVTSVGPGMHWRLSASAHAGATGAVPSGVQFSLPLFVELGREQAIALRRWTPSVRLGFERGFGASAQVPEGGAEFTWTTGRLDGCASFSAAPALALGPCLGFDVGDLQGVGQIAHPRDQSRVWFAVEGLARGRLKVGSPVFVEVEAGAVVPLARYTFIFDPGTYIYVVPAIGAKASTGIGLYFW
jgi:hypothetical protein